ncbi:MAG: ABC-type transport auxiliary lipoprotein family protein [Gammaproteobacteria bacterium]
MLSACGTIGPERGVDSHTYLLDPGLPAAQPGAVHGGMVQVAAPSVRAGYDTADMVYTRRPYELEYYALNEWASPPAAMLQPLVVRTLEAAGITTLVTSAGGRETRWRLDTELLELAHAHDEAGSTGQVALWAQLTRMDRSGTVSTRRFEARRPASAAEPYAGVAAMNEALGDVLNELAEFVGATLAAHTR